jgi:hypothetical protein
MIKRFRRNRVGYCSLKAMGLEVYRYDAGHGIFRSGHLIAEPKSLDLLKHLYKNLRVSNKLTWKDCYFDDVTKEFYLTRKKRPSFQKPVSKVPVIIDSVGLYSRLLGLNISSHNDKSGVSE